MHEVKDTKPSVFLTRELAGPETEGGRRSLFSETRTGSGVLSLSVLGSVFRRAERGDVRDLQTLAGATERKDPHVASMLQTRRLATLQAPWTVQPNERNPDATAHAELLSQVTELDSFPDMLYTLSDATYRAYAVSETMWETSESQWMPQAFHERDARWFRWLNTGELRIDDTTNGGDGTPMLPGKFIVHRATALAGKPQLAGLMFAVTLYGLYKQYALRDWLTYQEVFGMPVRIGKYDLNATPADISRLHAAVSDIGSDAGAVLPKTMEMEIMGQAGGASGGGALYENLLRWVDKATSKLILGQTMTAEDGSSEAQALVHQNVRYDLLRADINRMSRTLLAGLTRPLIDLNFGVQKPGTYPILNAAVREPEDLLPQMQAMKIAHDMGLDLPEKRLYTLLGAEKPEAQDAVLEGASIESPQAAASSGEPRDESQ